VPADYYVLLNSDVEVTPGWTEPVVRLMESQPTWFVAKILSSIGVRISEYAARREWDGSTSMGHIPCRGRNLYAAGGGLRGSTTIRRIWSGLRALVDSVCQPGYIIIS